MKSVKEQWKEVVGFPSYYISNTGRVRSTKRGTTKVLLQYDKRGYNCVALRLNNHPKYISVHRLVLMAFVGLAPLNYQCNHKNGIKTDNRLGNLEWVTPSDNIKHAFRTGLMAHSFEWRKQRSLDNRGQGNGRAKLRDGDIPTIRQQIKSGMTFQNIADNFHVSHATVWHIAKGRTWRHVL